MPVKFSAATVLRRVIIVAIVFACGWFAKDRLGQQPAAPVSQPVAEPYVVTQRLGEENFSRNLSFIAEVQAVNAVNLRPQVAGYIREIKFAEGSYVERGQELILIEQERYRANVLAAEAQLAREEVNLTQLERDFERQRALRASRAVSSAELESAEAQMLQARAGVQSARSNLDLARINLDYTVIRAPISGHIGKALVSAGNYVDASTQTLARIVQTDPVRIAFSLTARERLLVLERDGEHLGADIKGRLRLPDGNTLPVTPENVFFGSEASRTTGTMPVYLLQPNRNNLLLPGNYVDLLVSMDKGGVLSVPQSAVTLGEGGAYVMVVDENNIASRRYVTLGTGAQGRQVVTGGLEEGEVIIIEGVMKVQNGQRVRSSLIN